MTVVHRVCVVAILAMMSGPFPATAARTPEEPMAAGERPVLRVLDQTFGVLPGDDFTATFDLTGSPDDIGRLEEPLLADATVTVTVYSAVVDVDEVATLDEQRPSQPVARVELDAAEVVTTVDGVPTGELAIPLTTGETPGDGTNGLLLGRPGIHPVTIDVVAASAVVASALTFIEVLDPASPVGAPLAVSVVAGVDDPGPRPSPTELQNASIEVDKLIELAEAVDGPLSIALPPVLVSELTSPAGDEPSPATSEPSDTQEDEQAPTTSGPATSAGAPAPDGAEIESPDAFLDAFRADELLGVPAVALDPSALIAIDERDLFTAQLRRGEDILSTASPRAVVSRAVWLSDRPISADAVVMLRNLGIRMVVVSDQVADGLGVASVTPAARQFGVHLGLDGSLPAMTFSPLGAQLRTPPVGESLFTPNDRAVRLLVDIQLSRSVSDVPALVLATPRVTVPDPAITAQFVKLADEMPDISLVPISRLPGLVDRGLGAAPSAPVTLPGVTGADLSSRLIAVTATRENAAHASSMLIEADRRPAWNNELDGVMSSTIDDATAFAHLGETAAEINSVLGAIVVPDPFTFTLTGTSSTLRIRLQNTSTEPLNVMVDVRASKLRFPQQAPVTMVPAGGSVEIPVAVEARSNGTFSVEVDVLAPDGAPLTPPVILTARVTRVTGLSQVVTGGAALVLVSWWYSHLRRNRRRRLGAVAGDEVTVSTFDALAPDAAETLVARPPSSDRSTIDGGTLDPTRKRTTDAPDQSQ